jgi:hypothetical protein
MRRIFQVILIFQILLLSGLTRASVPSSVLSSGTWLKVPVTSDGIYRIDYLTLKQNGLANPSNPLIFCNNEGQLSYYNTGNAPDDLKEIAIYTSTGADGVFNDGDFLLFFGKATHKWKYDQTSAAYRYIRHNYSDTAWYFITSGPVPGKRITDAGAPLQEANLVSDRSDELFIHEAETENFLKSGREWFEPVSALTGIKINPGFSEIIVSEPVKFRLRVAGRSSSRTTFGVYEGTTVRGSTDVESVNLFNTTGVFANINEISGQFFPSSSSPSFEIHFSNNGVESAKGWIDYLWIQARVLNSFQGKTKYYMDSKAIMPGSVATFSITSPDKNPVIWDITDQYNVKSRSYHKENGLISFKARTDSLRTYAAFMPENSTVISKVTAVQNQDLHSSGSVGMIIITHPLFRSYADKLAAIHLQNSGLQSIVVTPAQVYNEFSGGVPDIAAIRNFVRMKYLKQAGTTEPLKYLLLFGDGSYENKTPAPNNPNFIPTYQSQNSNLVTASFTSDDFYGLLGEGEGEAEGTEDIGIGRLPVSDTVQAEIVISKIRKYLDPSNMGDWRNIICLVADDEDGNSHISDAEGLASSVSEESPEYNIDKIYMDAFRQVTTVNGQSYPDVNKAIGNRINSGCLIFNYVGHGSETGLAHERVVKIEDINSWKNGGKLPLFITATCEFSRFDDMDLNILTREMQGKTSAGELTLFNAKGGAIALMSTTRVVFSAPNYFLNSNIYSSAFARDEQGKPLRLGDIIRIAKNESGNGSNKRNFSLLGDPALYLAYPWHGRVITDSINNVPVSSPVDTLKALSLITVSGHIANLSGNPEDNFNGRISAVVYDKKSPVRTLSNDGGPVYEYFIMNSVLFSGRTMVENGRFRFTFIVPRDINYSFGNGKISYYALNDTEDMNGSFSDIVVGGFASAAQPDTTGPEISLFMNDTLFRNGGLTDRNPVLLALLSDEGGINTSGSGIGHDITGYIDSEKNNPFVLNSLYTNDFDNFKKGRLTYNLSDLEKGKHTFKVKAWDNFNNSSESTITFVVESDGSFVLQDLFNYPNPFVDGTNISGEHNRPGESLNLRILIFNMNGQLVKTITTKIPPGGYVLPDIKWDGCNDMGNRVPSGIYPYVVTVTTDSGEKCRSSGRMIIM